MKGEKTFLDTNILVYAYDTSAGAKHETAREILVELWQSGRGVLSTQILQEFYVNVTQKIPRPVDRGTARKIVADLLTWDVVVNDGGVILDAIDTQREHTLSFWDSMVVQAAVKSGAKVLLSEDLADGRTVDGVIVANPFLRHRLH